MNNQPRYSNPLCRFRLLRFWTQSHFARSQIRVRCYLFKSTCETVCSRLCKSKASGCLVCVVDLCASLACRSYLLSKTFFKNSCCKDFLTRADYTRLTASIPQCKVFALPVSARCDETCLTLIYLIQHNPIDAGFFAPRKFVLTNRRCAGTERSKCSSASTS
jgi:hypothetical protein